MSEITVAKFKDVANGLQPGQFAIGERTKIRSLSDLDPIFKALLDRPITVTLMSTDSTPATTKLKSASSLAVRRTASRAERDCRANCPAATSPRP